MSVSIDGNRSLSTAGSGRQLHLIKRSLSRGATVALTRTSALANAIVASPFGAADQGAVHAPVE